MYRAETVWTECSVHGEGKFSNVSWGETEKLASERGFAYVPFDGDLLYQKTAFHEAASSDSEFYPLVRKGY